MTVLAVLLTVLLLLETLPAAIAGLSRKGLERFDDLTGLGTREGRNLGIVTLVGALHAVAAALLVVGFWQAYAGALGALLEIGGYAWVLYRQVSRGQRGQQLLAYEIFVTTALAVLIVQLLR